MSSPYAFLRHVTAKLWKCKVSKDLIGNLDWLLETFNRAIEKSQTRIIKVDSHSFSPEGITIFAILADSHAVLHTWPEENFVMIEIFTCGDRSRPIEGVIYLVKEFRPTRHDVVETCTRI